MNDIQFEKLTTDIFGECCVLMTKKGPDYATDPGNEPEAKDRLWNFKEVARRTGQDPIQVWAVYFNKHIVSIEKWVRERELQSEPLEERIKDAINYLVLLQALIVDKRFEEPRLHVVSIGTLNLEDATIEHNEEPPKAYEGLDADKAPVHVGGTKEVIASEVTSEAAERALKSGSKLEALKDFFFSGAGPQGG